MKRLKMNDTMRNELSRIKISRETIVPMFEHLLEQLNFEREIEPEKEGLLRRNTIAVCNFHLSKEAKVGDLDPIISFRIGLKNFEEGE